MCYQIHSVICMLCHHGDVSVTSHPYVGTCVSVDYITQGHIEGGVSGVSGNPFRVQLLLMTVAVN